MHSETTTDTKLAQLFAHSSARLYRKGEVIICAGDDPEGVMLIEQGVVEQYDVTPAGNKIVVNRFKPRAFFPMSWAINKTPNEYYFSASTNVSLKFIAASQATDFIQQNPDVAYDLLRRVFSGTDGMIRRLVVTSGGSAADRVAYELLNESYRFGQPQSDPAWRLVTIRQQNIAERSGLARETVSRELGKLEKQGLIIHASRGIKVCVSGLEQK